MLLLPLATSLLVLSAAAAPQNKDTTLTLTATKTETQSTTITGHSTVYTTATYDRPGIFPIYHYVYTDTQTSTVTSTVSTTTYVRPTATSSVAPRPGYTGILEESVYTDALDIEKTTTTVTSTSTFDPSPTTMMGSFGFRYTSFQDITTTTPSYIYVGTTVTSTSTVAPSVRYVADACKSENLATKIPTGQLIRGVGQYADTGYDTAFTDNPEDCCGICQAREGCFGGTWALAPEVGNCFIFLINPNNASEVCDGSVAYGTFADSAANTFQDIAFNGPCGQLSWRLYDADYF